MRTWYPISGDVCLLHGLLADDVGKMIAAQLEPLAIQNYQFEDILAVPATETHRQAEIAQVLASTVEQVTGTPPWIEGSNRACAG